MLKKGYRQSLWLKTTVCPKASTVLPWCLWACCTVLSGLTHTFTLSSPLYRYMSAARLGDVLTLDAKCVKAGKKVAFATMDIVNKETGAVVAQGRQTKFLG